MGKSDLNVSFQVILIVFGHISVICGIAWLFMKFVSKVKTRGTYAAVAAFSALGGFLGYTVSSSRQPITGIVLPALLTFITALLGYLFSKENLRDWRPVIPYCIMVLSLNTFLGLIPGSVVRQNSETFERAYEVWLLEKKDYFEIRKEKEKRILQAKSPDQLDEELNLEYEALEKQKIAEEEAKKADKIW